MNAETVKNLSETVMSFIGLLAAGLLTVALPFVVASIASWLRARSQELSQRLNNQQLQMVQAVAELVVRAAEQNGNNGVLVSGPEKKKFAIDMARGYFRNLGIKMDAASIAGLIESEVMRQFRNSSGSSDSAQVRSDLLARAVHTAVLAAEQSGIKRRALEAGLNLAEEKKTYAVNLAADYLAQHGIRVPPDLIDGMIEAQLIRFRIEAAQNHLRISYGRLLAAFAIAGRAGIGAGRARADAKGAAFIDIGDGAAAGANRRQIDHRREDGIAAHHGVARVHDAHFAAWHDTDIGRSATNIDRNQILNTR